MKKEAVPLVKHKGKPLMIYISIYIQLVIYSLNDERAPDICPALARVL